MNPDFLQVSGTTHVWGRNKTQAVVEIAAQKHEVIRFDVGLDYAVKDPIDAIRYE